MPKIPCAIVVWNPSQYWDHCATIASGLIEAQHKEHEAKRRIPVCQAHSTLYELGQTLRFFDGQYYFLERTVHGR